MERRGISVRGRAKRLRAARLLLLPVLLAAPACSTSPYLRSIEKLAIGTKNAASGDAVFVAAYRQQRDRLNLVRVMRGNDAAPSSGCGTTAAETECVLEAEEDRLEKRAREIRAGRLVNPGGIGIPPRPDLSQRLTAQAAAADQNRPPAVCLEHRQAAERFAEVRTGAAAASAGKPAVSVTEARILKALADYGEALQDVTNASDHEDFNTASDKLTTAAVTLATTVGAFGGPAGLAVAGLVGPAVKIGAFVLGESLEAARLRALRQGLLDACIPFRTLATAAGLIGAGRQDLQFEASSITLNLAKPGTLPRGVAPVPLFLIGQQAASAIDSLRADPLETARQQIKAHDDLIVAVATGADQSQAGLEALTKFVNLAVELKKAAEAAAAASRPAVAAPSAPAS